MELSVEVWVQRNPISSAARAQPADRKAELPELASGHREAQKCDIFLSGLAPGHKSESAVLTGVPVIPSGCGYTAWCMGNTETAGLEWSKCTIWTRKLIPDW